MEPEKTILMSGTLTQREMNFNIYMKNCFVEVWL